MKSHIRTFNRLIAEMNGDRDIDFELVTEDKPLDMRRSLHRHECFQLRTRIPKDRKQPIQVEVIYPGVCHYTLSLKDYNYHYIWFLDMERPDLCYPYDTGGTFNTEYIPTLTGALDRLRAAGRDDPELKRECRKHMRLMAQKYMHPVIRDPQHDTKVQWLQRHYLNHYYRSDLSIARTAREVELSPSYIQRVFFAATGQTPKAFLTRVRMEHAVKFLNERRYPVKQVAAMCGYKSLDYFSDAFRRFYGCPPTRFVKNAASAAAAAGELR